MMNTYESNYSWIKPIKLSKYKNCKIYNLPKSSKIIKNTLKDSLENPLGSEPLGSLIRKKKINKAVIIVDDISRPTPQKEILPQVLSIFKKEGITQEKIEILIALGLHRPMNEKEISQRFGTTISSSYKIINHEAFNDKNLVSIGKSSDGTEIRINRLLTQADFIMGIGQVSPHRVAGFSGGAKIIQPGVCGEEITASIHWRGWTTESKKIFAIKDNQIRREINEIGNLVGLDFIVNVIMEENNVLHYYSGNHVIALNQAMDDIIKNYTITIPESDIVVIEALPYDFDIWQAAKAVSLAELIIKSEGTVILLASCPDKWTMHYSQMKKTGYLPYSKIVEEVEAKRLNKFIGCHFAAFGRVLQEGKVVVISNNLEKEDVEAMNLGYADDLDSAIENELSRIGNRDAIISIIKDSGKIIPKKV